MPYNEYQESADQGSEVLLFLFETDNGLMKWAYTTDGDPITVNAVEYIPEAIKATDRSRSSSNESVDEMTVTVPYTNPVAIAHVPYLPVRPIKLKVYSYQRRDATVELTLWFEGRIRGFQQKGPHVDLRCLSSDEFAIQVPWPIQKAGCVLATYSDRCSVDKELFATAVGAITSFAATTIQAAAFAMKADGWFTGGYIEDLDTGELRFITEHVGDTIKVVYPITGMALTKNLKAYAGDDHSAATCHVKFNNKVNYLGHDHQPTFNVFVDGTGKGGGGAGGGYSPGGPGSGSNRYSNTDLYALVDAGILDLLDDA